MSKLLEYNIKKSTRPDYNWMITARDISKTDSFPYAVAFINSVFLDDYGIAQAIVKSLESSKFTPDLSI